MARQRAMLCNIGKDYGNATGQCSAKMLKMLCNIERYNGKATGNALQFWKKIMAGRQDNAL
jgi:hypothetical protein